MTIVKSLDKEIAHQLSQLMQEANIKAENLKISFFNLGGNNQTFRVETSSGVFVAKKYFSHQNDKRNRLENEFSFLSFAHDIAKNSVPQAIAKLEPYNMALYEYIEGKPFMAGDVGENEVRLAADFFCMINQPKYRIRAQHIPKASEACFSLEEHILLIQNRIDQISKIKIESEETKQAKLISVRLNEYSKQLKSHTLLSDLSLEQWCISPSDFGFHNALRRPDNTLCFIDFEYSGWDDPAKMVADFFSQLAVPVPSQYFKSFTEKVMSCFPGPNDLIKRAFYLRPIYQIKWCCIALNIFLPYHLERRKFANKDLNLVELQQNQLNKAEKILERLEKEHAWC